MTLKFNAKTHRYWLDGKPVPGVTSLIKGGLPAPALVYWAARTVAEYVADNGEAVEQLRTMGRNSMVAALKETPWTARDTAGIRGTDVHALAERLVWGEEVETPEHIAGHVEACARFLDLWKPKGLVVEKSVGHRAHWWAGRPDLLAELPDGRVALFDWKTAKGIYPETAYQLAAYSHAEFWVEDDETTEHPLPKVDFCAAVHIREDGFDVIPVDGSDATYKHFRHIAFVAGAAKNNKELVGAPLAGPDYVGWVA
jgi:hypothetical protein